MGVAVSSTRLSSSELEAVSSARTSSAVLDAVVLEDVGFALEDLGVLLLLLGFDVVVGVKVVAEEVDWLVCLAKVVVENEVLVVVGPVAVPVLDIVMIEVEVSIVAPPAEDVGNETCGVATEKTELVAWADICSLASWLVVM